MLVLFEDAALDDLNPLLHWRCVWDMRCGVQTLLEKIFSLYPGERVRLWGRPAMEKIVDARGGRLNAPLADIDEPVLFVNGRAILRQTVAVSGPAEIARQGDQVVWLRVPAAGAMSLQPADFLEPARLEAAVARLAPAAARAEAALLRYPWDVVAQNGKEIEADCRRLWSGFRHAARVDPGAVLLNEGAIQIGRGSRVKPTAVLDAENGPIYIGANATISPHTYIQGPAAIGDGSLVQPATVIRNGTAVGPMCKIGGELEETVIFGYSNKQHDGFLGHSVIAEWCNLGAATVNSDLKNTYGSVRIEWPVGGHRAHVSRIDHGRPRQDGRGDALPHRGDGGLLVQHRAVGDLPEVGAGFHLVDRQGAGADGPRAGDRGGRADDEAARAGDFGPRGGSVPGDGPARNRKGLIRIRLGPVTASWAARRLSPFRLPGSASPSPGTAGPPRARPCRCGPRARRPCPRA
jgi:UDP-N-acetylglucosamine diphosphorylase/glucosamine-1-phosphate N-acetyltransferase